MDMGLRNAELVSLVNIVLCQIELGQYINAENSLSQLLNIPKELGPYLYGYVLYARARKNRYLQQPEKSITDIKEGMECFQKHQLLQPYAILLCEYGHILLALKKPVSLVQEVNKEACALLKKLGVTHDSELGTAVRRLSSALDAYIYGTPLCVGSVQEELTTEVRESLLP